MKEPAARPVVWTQIVKSLFSRSFSPGLGLRMMLEIMLAVEGILPITGRSVSS